MKTLTWVHFRTRPPRCMPSYFLKVSSVLRKWGSYTGFWAKTSLYTLIYNVCIVMWYSKKAWSLSFDRGSQNDEMISLRGEYRWKREYIHWYVVYISCWYTGAEWVKSLIAAVTWFKNGSVKPKSLIIFYLLIICIYVICWL